MLNFILLLCFILILKVAIIYNFRYKKRDKFYYLNKYEKMNFRNKKHYLKIRKELKKLFPEFFNFKKPINLYKIKKYLESKNIYLSNYLVAEYNFNNKDNIK